jgi:type III pantothenate kinase
VVAAYNKSQSAVLVVDAGSAITVDAVDAEGYHLGGYIAPGSALMKYALETKTSGVRFAENFVQGNKGFGGSTDSAVQAGIFAAQLGMVEVALQEAKKVLGEYNLYLTGGGALALHNQLSTVGFHEPDLVLDGLAWLIP